MAGAPSNPCVVWLEPIALLAASRRANQLSEEARVRMQPWVEAAAARFAVARELRDARSQRVALALLEQAAFFALCALELSGSQPDSVARTASEAWQRFEARSQSPAGAPEELARVRSAFSTTDDALALERIPPREANELRLAAENVVAWLLSLAEVRRPAELARTRLVRGALAAVGLVVVVWGLVAYWLSLAAIEPH